MSIITTALKCRNNDCFGFCSWLKLYSICVLYVFSSQEVQLCEGGGETAGEEGEEALAAAGAQGEESTGTG